jgi:hypothetical protein
MSRHVSPLHRYSKRTFLALTPRTIIASQARKRLIQQFANKIGLVYFGTVSQQSDEHTLVRGITLSPEHQDTHYCIGSLDGYDITFVERSAIVAKEKRGVRSQLWHIMAVDLHQERDLPHIFINVREHGELLHERMLTSLPSFREIPPVSLPDHSKEFIQHYRVFTPPAQFVRAAQLLPPAITKVIDSHFAPFAIEITSDCVYIYADQQRLTMQVLDILLKDAIWLAKHIDAMTIQ